MTLRLMRWISSSLFLLLCFSASHPAEAQLRLSEPESESAVERPDVDLPTSSRLRNKSRKPPASAAPKGNSASQPAFENSSLSSVQQRLADTSDSLRLITQDPAPVTFFSGPVPRTLSIGEDAALNDVCHIGTFCWAVGDRGVICLSADGGETWTTQLTPAECSLRSVCFLTNRIGWIAGLRTLPGTSQETAVLLHTRDGGITWKDLASSASEATGSETLATSSLPGILHLQFFGLEEAIAVTLPVPRRNGAGVFRSDDGGRSWTALSTDRPGSMWTAGMFLSPSEGIVVGRRQSYATITSDQAVVINPPRPTLRQMRGTSLGTDGNGWIVGDGAMILKTGNSGVTWEAPSGEISRTVSELVDLHTVAHHGANVLLAGNPAGILLRSVSDGDRWEIRQIPATGRINRIYFMSETESLAVGSLGQILRSSDAGATWHPVRSGGLRTGILNLVTDADNASWQLLSQASADDGVRSLTLQISQPLNTADGSANSDNAMHSERTQLACTQLGGNESVADWMFPRTQPEHHLSADQLIAEWNRQTDGELRRLLPLRLARDLRNWKPSMIVIEPTSDNDAVAAILRDAVQWAIQLAASDDHSDVLSQVGLSPWTVDRVIGRVGSDHHSSLSFSEDDLLSSLGTTTGLLCDAALSVFPGDFQPSGNFRSRADYEVVLDRNDRVGLQRLLDGLDSTALINARRPLIIRPREEVGALRDTLRKAHIEGSAVQGHAKLAKAEESLTAELQGLGAGLPDQLAAKQLRDLAGLNLQQNNMEGYLAVQKEVIRRYPNSEDGRKAAEMLFLFYSSAEARFYRFRSASKLPLSGVPAAATASPPSSGNAFRLNENDADYDISAQPEFRPPTSQAFSANASDPVAALQELWDRQAATALQILSTDRSDEEIRREISPLVRLRHAANQRRQDRVGEHSNALAELTQRNDEFGVFARAEMQLYTAVTPGLPTYNLPQRADPPYLDGKLTDLIWQEAEEIPLGPFERSRSVAADGIRQLSAPNENTPGSFAMITWDEEFLYFAGRFERVPQNSGAVELASHRTHDASHDNRDRFELELDTDRDFITSFQLTVDESGLTSDRCWMLDRWNPQWFVAVDSDDTVWRVEAAIPLSELAARPAKPGDIWSIKLRRILPGVLQHELLTPGGEVSTQGTAIVRFIRPKVVTRTRSRDK